MCGFVFFPVAGGCISSATSPSAVAVSAGSAGSGCTQARDPGGSPRPSSALCT